jgi:hypothetical protein
MKSKTPSTPRSSRPAPRIPGLGRPPAAARIATLALFVIGGYALLFGVSYLDLLRRLLLTVLAGGTLPAWALVGFVTGALGGVYGFLAGRSIIRAARRISDQDPRGTTRIALLFTAAVGVHAVLVAGPLNRWSPAAPFAGEALLGAFAVLFVPAVVILAAVATVARGRAQGWLDALPD